MGSASAIQSAPDTSGLSYRTPPYGLSAFAGVRSIPPCLSWNPQDRRKEPRAALTVLDPKHVVGRLVADDHIPQAE